MTITARLGIDSATPKFDVVLTWTAGRRAKVFRNERGGWPALLTWWRDLDLGQIHAGLEATGRSGEGLALQRHEAGHRVSVVPPAQITPFARPKLGRNQSDRVAAAVICQDCRLFEPAAWTPPSAAVPRFARSGADP